MSDFWPWELQNNTFVLFKLKYVAICYGSNEKLTVSPVAGASLPLPSGPQREGVSQKREEYLAPGQTVGSVHHPRDGGLCVPYYFSDS